MQFDCVTNPDIFFLKQIDRDTVFRDDKPEHWQDREDLMKNAPAKANGFIKVPVIINKDDDQ